MSKLVWFHFSDLHFRARDDFDRARVLGALWDDVRRQMSRGLVPDFLMITGDIAFSGKAEEYKRAEIEFIIPLLEMTGIDRERLFLVPGNHDLNRARISNLNAEKVLALQE